MVDLGSEGIRSENLRKNCCRLILMKCLGFSPEDLYKVDASKLESLAAEIKALNEEIARLEQEREKEPVSKCVSELT